MAGTFSVTYTRARIEKAQRNLFDRGITSLASRDVRLFILTIGALTGQGFATLIILALLTNIVVLLRVLYMRHVLKAEKEI